MIYTSSRVTLNPQDTENRPITGRSTVNGDRGVGERSRLFVESKLLACAATKMFSKNIQQKRCVSEVPWNWRLCKFLPIFFSYFWSEPIQGLPERQVFGAVSSRLGHVGSWRRSRTPLGLGAQSDPLPDMFTQTGPTSADLDTPKKTLGWIHKSEGFAKSSLAFEPGNVGCSAFCCNFPVGQWVMRHVLLLNGRRHKIGEVMRRGDMASPLVSWRLV